MGFLEDRFYNLHLKNICLCVCGGVGSKVAHLVMARTDIVEKD